MTLRPIGIDSGSTDCKVVAGGISNRYLIPNVIAPAPEKRVVIGDEISTKDTLHFKVFSPSLKVSGGTFVAGNLAKQYTKEKMEMAPKTDKSTSDQVLIMMILAAALDAVQNFRENEDGIIVGNYVLGTCLPVSEIKRGMKPIFEERLKQIHEIHFLQTVGLQGKKVRIHFKHVVVGVEGLNALFDLSTPDGYNIPAMYPDILTKNIVLVDIGGGTTESEVIQAGKPNSVASDGDAIGVNEYIDRICDRINAAYKHRPQRQTMVDRIKDKSYSVKIRGEEKPVDTIIQEEFGFLSDQIFTRFIDPAWKNVDDLDQTVFIGGGSICLKKQLKAKMDEAKYPYWFLPEDKEEDGIWLNGKGGFKMAQKKAMQLGVA